MQAIILAIGDELVLGQTVDTNSAWVSQRLARLGVTTYAHQTVSDDRKAIELAIRWAAHNADVVIVSGGLGPTADDLTREALADAMDVELVEDADSVARLEAFFADRGRTMPQRNRVQALHPAGTTMIPNKWGTAPGIKARLDRAEIYVVPGVPREMRGLVETVIEPELAERGDGRVILTTKINTFGFGESDVAEMLGDLMDRDRNPTVGTTVADGVCSVRVRSVAGSAKEADDALQDTIAAVNERLGAIVYGQEDQTLQEAVIRMLEHTGRRLTTAESCTGGLIAAMLTEVPGCSVPYMGGWVTYSNMLKIEELGVPRTMIDEHGAVSEPVVRVMAKGALCCVGADLAISVSGIAGPDGGTPEKPVGTVWLGLASIREDDRDQVDTQALRLKLIGDRAAIRDRAAKCALQMLRLHLLDQPLTLLRWAVPSETPTR